MFYSDPKGRGFTLDMANPCIDKALKGKLKGLNYYRLNRKDRILSEIYLRFRELGTASTHF